MLAAACAVPRGRVTTYAAIAAHLEIVPRHVAFVLAGLKGAEGDEIPWHRVVAADGRLRQSSPAGLRRQKERLAAEGIAVTRGPRVADFARLVFRWPPRRGHPGLPARGPYSDPATPPLFEAAHRFGYPPRAAFPGLRERG
ncbi:MAG TPA: MGMT family protein [Verrucomicrobiota bacterium]|nr:MGMT family protein [Verrucomicrobiota bacterium]